MAFRHYKRENFKFEINFLIYIFFRFHRTFFGSLIKRGRKLWAFNFFNRIKSQLKLKAFAEPNNVFFSAVLRIAPSVLIFPYKIGGKFREVALPITWYKKVIFATKWIIKLLIDKFKRINLSDAVEVMILSLINKGLSMDKRQLYCKLGKPNRDLFRRFK